MPLDGYVAAVVAAVAVAHLNVDVDGAGAVDLDVGDDVQRHQRVLELRRLVPQPHVCCAFTKPRAALVACASVKHTYKQTHTPHTPRQMKAK